MNYKIGIIGIGFVGNAILQSLQKKNFKQNEDLFIYDKYKDIGNIIDILKSNILFLALPTPFNNIKKEYDIDAIYEILQFLEDNKYNGCIVIKSTVEPETCYKLNNLFSNLNLVHNPEFLSAKTAIDDFHHQKHIVIGKSKICNEENLNLLISFYKKYYDAEISLCSSLESESMKIFCNSFYAIKVQFFTELYLLCQKNECDFLKVKELMLKNGWINPMHTNIPGPDGNISYGGLCFPKDTAALNEYMKKLNSNNKVLDSTILERNEMRNSKDSLNDIL